MKTVTFIWFIVVGICTQQMQAILVSNYTHKFNTNFSETYGICSDGRETELVTCGNPSICKKYTVQCEKKGDTYTLLQKCSECNDGSKKSYYTTKLKGSDTIKPISVSNLCNGTLAERADDQANENKEKKALRLDFQTMVTLSLMMVAFLLV